ncbi:hypothetical protein SPM19_11925 [Enterobacter hormaechei subsp. xiangfangensis]|nr:MULTISPECIES: hypothetical protein [Enterobacter cloacae complex]MCU3659650.1 hypothetical protein [Enterobacter hormaechei subsp. steigerwaltii]ASQ18606.1 hypothetical protein BJM06_02821 [Enterobacter cloacae]EHN8907531.1 hypothetical protein [Enterobacter hormaechei]ELD3410085.1 hypothetical protein [Enterobacter hormaechei]MBT1858621.1 hypothetical protein [Enterobacter hormaechei subsp. xiangfangensis]
MALVEIVASNLHAGANLRKLEVGSVVDVDDATAERWISTGKAKETDKKKGEKLAFEVATPSAPAADLTALQKQLADALEQNQKLIADGEAKDKAHADTLAAETKRADEAEAALAEAIKKAK